MKRTFDKLLNDIFISKKKKDVIKVKDDVPTNVRLVLNKIRDVFTDNDIQYEIPFVYKNNDYKNIKILVTNLYPPPHLCDLLEVTEFKVNKEFIDIYINDVKVTLILTPLKDFYISFWYYSWDITSTLMNVLLDGFGLRLDKDGLRYVYKGNYLISTKINEIIEFLGLDFNKYKSGFFSLDNEIDFIMNSPVFNADLFFNYKLNPKDHFYKEKSDMFKRVLEIYEPLKNSVGNYTFNEKKEVYMNYVSEYFFDSGLIDKLLLKK